jgi:hypothetical protein
MTFHPPHVRNGGPVRCDAMPKQFGIAPDTARLLG